MTKILFNFETKVLHKNNETLKQKFYTKTMKIMALQ